MNRRAHEPVRILLLESGTGGGGSVNFLRDFLLHIDPKRLNPFVGCYSPNFSPTMNEIRSWGIPVTCFRNSTPATRTHTTQGTETTLTLTKRLLKPARIAFHLLTQQFPLVLPVAAFLRRNEIELVLLNQDVHYHLPGLLAAKLLGLPCICRKAGGIGEARRLKRIITPWVDVFVSISEATYQDQRNTPGTKKLLMIYRGVDLSRFDSLAPSAGLRTELGLPFGKKVIATISRIEEGKGHREFLQMAAELRKRGFDAVFLIVGDQWLKGGTLVAELKAMTRDLGIEDTVVFAGWREDIPSILGLVDIFVHCPTTFIEGLCVANLEAMAMGKPTVVSRNGGLVDAVLDGVTGFIVPPGDIPAMTQAVERLLTDDQLRQEMGAQARRRARQLFDISQTVQQLENLLVEYAARRRLRYAKPQAEVKTA
jgi:glycosyltransferase involved in cell wall biosynthesis